MDIKQFAQEVHKTAVDKGWWENRYVGLIEEWEGYLQTASPKDVPGEGLIEETIRALGTAGERNIGEAVLLVVTVLDDAYTKYKDIEGNIEAVDIAHDSKPRGVPVELADAIIRLFDFCVGFGIDIEWALELKAEYNKIRPYRHGNRRA